MTKKRSTFRSRQGAPSNHHILGPRRLSAYFDRLPLEDRKRIIENQRKPNLTRADTRHLPGETGRQLAARLRAEAPVEAPAPKKTRAKKVAA